MNYFSLSFIFNSMSINSFFLMRASHTLESLNVCSLQFSILPSFPCQKCGYGLFHSASPISSIFRVHVCLEQITYLKKPISNVTVSIKRLQEQNYLIEKSFILKSKSFSLFPKIFRYQKGKLSYLSEFDSKSTIKGWITMTIFCSNKRKILWAFFYITEKDYLKYLEISIINTQSLKMHISIDKFQGRIYSRNTSETLIDPNNTLTTH